MSQVTADVAWWKYWVAMFCSTGLTVGVAFGLQGYALRWRSLGFLDEKQLPNPGA